MIPSSIVKTLRATSSKRASHKGAKAQKWSLATLILLVCMGMLLQNVVVPLAFAQTAPGNMLGVQDFLEQQPGVLKTYQEDGQLASTIIESNSLYYGINPYLHLALLETTNSLLSDPNPPPDVLRRPYGPGGPEGFAAQIEWASRELRAGLGPYDDPPTLHFTDEVEITLNLNQSMEGIAVQRFLANERSSTEWQTLNDRFVQIFQDYFDGTLPEVELVSPSGEVLPPPTSGFLQCPWPMGMHMVHLAYFDHAYPTVDIGGDGNNVVVTYVGAADVQYNTHDGHDYYFPSLPIGTPILAAAPGLAYAHTEVRGNGVVILHAGGYETVYWHLNHFAPRFRSIVDTGQAIWVETGDVLGTSGTSGFSYGSPHLHFEVRRHGKQVDPYSWYGPGEDPCTSYAACEDNGWLWHSDLYGLYDFTPPDYTPSNGDMFVAPALDMTPPIGTLSINPPDGLLLLVRFDGHTVQEVGRGQAAVEGIVNFQAGRYDRGVHLPLDSGLTYPISGNLSLESGTLSVWAHIPETYPEVQVSRHYLFAASANPEDGERGYPNTMALRREFSDYDGLPQWNFWTVAQDGQAHSFVVSDTLQAGWHHIATTWDSTTGSKALFVDGKRVVDADGVLLPGDVGEVLQLGRFTYGGLQSGVVLDELAVFDSALPDERIAAIAQSAEPLQSSRSVLQTTDVWLDTNAADAEGLIVAMQPSIDGDFEDPLPYYDTLRWTMEPEEGQHTLAVRYFDRASNRRVVSQTVTLDLPPRGHAQIRTRDAMGATLVVSATDTHMPIEMQLSQSKDFVGAVWEPLRNNPRWIWDWDMVKKRDEKELVLYVRFRDAQGTLSAPLVLAR